MKGIIITTAFTTIVALSVGCSRNDPSNSEYNGASPEIRHKVDTTRNRVWSLTRYGVHLYDREMPEKIRHIPLPGWVMLGTPSSNCMSDLVLGANGEVVVSSDVLPWLWRIDSDTLIVTKHELALDADIDQEIGFSALAYSAEQKAFFAISYFHGSLWRIDASLEHAQKVLLSAPIWHACGLTIRPNAFEQKVVTEVALCMSAEQGGRTVALAPDQRSGYVRPRSCS